MEPSKSNSDSDSWESISTDSDPESVTSKFLDIRSPRFSPKLALKCSNLKLPDPGAPKFFSVVQFQNKVPCLSKHKFSPKKKNPNEFPGTVRRGATSLAQVSLPSASSTVPTSQTTPAGVGADAQASSSSAPFYPIPGRRFLPHQLPVFRPRKQHPNVLTLMETMEGPYSSLNKARLNGSRIKVWTKNAEGFRGYSLGTLIAFDKHWNLVLRDVDETIQRKRTIKVPLVQAHERQNDDSFSAERSDFKSGQLLSTYTKMTKIATTRVQPGQQTQYLVESADALDLCRRIGAISLNSQNNQIYHPRAGADAAETKPSKSQFRKKRLVVLRRPYEDAHGHRVVAQSHLYEIVERHISQMLLMGDNVIFIETHPN